MADDNIDTVGKAFLGLTLGCARCHDHKFDPISTEDYYGLAGIFYSTHILKDLGAKGAEYEMNRVPLVPRAVVQQRTDHELKLKDVQAQLATLDQQQRYHDLTAGGVILIAESIMSAPDSMGQIAVDGVVTVSGPECKDSYTVKAIAPADTEVRWVRLEVLSDPQLPSQGPGRAAGGNFQINRFSVLFAPPESIQAPTTVSWSSVRADFEQKGFGVAGTIDEKPETGWSIHPAVGQNHVASFEVAAQVKIPPGSVLTFIIDQTQSEKHALGKFRLSVASTLAPSTPIHESERAELMASRENLQKELSIPLPVAMAVEEGGMPGGLFPKIQDVPIHIRGSYTKLGPIVPRRMPRFLAGENQPVIDQGSGRKALANWIATKNNPLTSRVIVNRIWQWHFGEGLVRTPSNFGKLGERPTHPELLDWMAAQFMDDGWSLKQLHRRIMNSATYQQASQTSRDSLLLDPENVWLGRFAARRMEAEAIRDAMLSVTGQLDPLPGGPAVDDFTSRRRSLYVQTARWDRSGYAMLFDAANPDSSTEKRIVSTVAPQALLLLNHDLIHGQAKQLAERLFVLAPQDDAMRLQTAYQLLFGRLPTSEEIAIAHKIIQIPEADPKIGWTDLAHVLLCSNEFVYLD